MEISDCQICRPLFLWFFKFLRLINSKKNCQICGPLFDYIFGGWCPDSWKGFTMAVFKDLWPVVKLSISSGFMLCLEMWCTAVLVLLARYMKHAEVAIDAFSICLNIHDWEFMITQASWLLLPLLDHLFLELGSC